MIGKKTGKFQPKKFVFVQTKQEFDKIGIVNQQPPCHEDSQDCEQDLIIVPKFQKIPTPPTPKNTAPLSESYIKTISPWGTISRDKYQLDATDICFLQNRCPTIGDKIFTEMLVSLEKAANRFGTQLNYQKILSKKLNDPCRVIEVQKEQNLLRDIYIFWRNKRKNLKSPLLRLFWSKCEIGPFKQRQNCNMLCLRNRTIKLDLDSIKSYLMDDLLKLKEILLTMKTREKQEKNLINLQLSVFKNKIKRVLRKVKETKTQEENLIKIEEGCIKQNQRKSVGRPRKEKVRNIQG